MMMIFLSNMRLQGNIFDLAQKPDSSDEEWFETIFQHPGVRIERIISTGQSSPEGFWYDQEEAEWVLLLAGKAVITFENEENVELNLGDYRMIPAHCRHRVASTMMDAPTVWLAIFLK